MDDTEEDWAKWRHPLDMNKPHPWVRDSDAVDWYSDSPQTTALRDRHGLETANYLYLTLAWRNPVHELQDIAQDDYVFDLKELHSFCGKAAGMYAMADFRAPPLGESPEQAGGLSGEHRQLGLCGRLYAEWFELVESDGWETRFFAHFLQTRDMNIEQIVAAHRAVSEKVERQMRGPVRKVGAEEDGFLWDEIQHHDQCTFLPTFRDLVVVVEERSFRSKSLLLVLRPERAIGIAEMAEAQESVVAGLKVVSIRLKMEEIMRAVVKMQRKAAESERGVTGRHVE